MTYVSSRAGVIFRNPLSRRLPRAEGNYSPITTVSLLPVGPHHMRPSAASPLGDASWVTQEPRCHHQKSF